MTTAVKICGIKTTRMVEICALAGAQFIGVVFAKDSPRYVDLNIAQAIANSAHQHALIPVGVFTDMNAQTIITICKQTAIEYVQLHGENAKNALFDLPEQLHKIYVNPINQEHLNYLRPHKDFLLYDHEQPGSGKITDWASIQAPKNLRFFLAGGLNINNVQEAIEVVHPYAVDVSSGVESTRGEKSAMLIEQFIQKVHHG